MFSVNEDKSIYATRGDIVFFSVSAEEDGAPYVFQPGDIVRLSIYGKKDTENVLLQRDFPVSEETESVYIYLGEHETKIGEPISKGKDYWYEIVLNPDTAPQTIIGYDEDGAKVFRLFPEAEETEEYIPNEEDIPVVDAELDLTSPRPVTNSAITTAIFQLQGDVEKCLKAESGAERPTMKPVGYMFFDASLGKPIWFNGTGWVDVSGVSG